MVKKKIATILKSQSGASLAFYLAIMFFLMAIAGSVLASASTAAGIAGERRKDVQLDIYVESVVKSLNETIVNGSLGKNIVLGIYDRATGSSPPTPEPNKPLLYVDNFTLIQKVENGTTLIPPPNGMTISPIEINFLSSQQVQIIPSFILTEPPEVMVNFEMVSVVTGIYDGKTLAVETTYSYSGYLKGSTIVDGTWQVVSYEKLDQG